MRGAGKAGIGRRVGSGLAVPCVEADAEIGQAAGSSIPEIFGRHGEAAFREGERRVIARLLRQPVHVLATGGGAFMDESTRAAIAESAISPWLRADRETLWRRVSRRANRPLRPQIGRAAGGGGV